MRAEISKIYVVEELFVGADFLTEVWIADEVLEAFDDLEAEDRKRFLKKLQYYAKAGFENFERAKGPIRHEGNGVYRVGHKRSLFRVVGFYNAGKAEYIAITAFTKGGQKLSTPERARIQKVAKVKRRGAWRKK